MSVLLLFFLVCFLLQLMMMMIMMMIMMSWLLDTRCLHNSRIGENQKQIAKLSESKNITKTKEKNRIEK